MRKGARLVTVQRRQVGLCGATASDKHTRVVRQTTEKKKERQGQISTPSASNARLRQQKPGSGKQRQSTSNGQDIIDQWRSCSVFGIPNRENRGLEVVCDMQANFCTQVNGVSRLSVDLHLHQNTCVARNRFHNLFRERQNGPGGSIGPFYWFSNVLSGVSLSLSSYARSSF